MRTKKRQLNIEELLKMIEFLPDSSEESMFVTSKILYKNGDSLPFSATNYFAVQFILDRCYEGEKIRKQARNEIEGIYDYITGGTFGSDTLKEKSKLLRRLIRLTIIAY